VSGEPASGTGITAIVLAGGESSRFGGDKLAADLGGSPVLHHALRAVAAVVDDIVLVLAPGAPVPPVPAPLAGRVSVTRDREALGGPLAGVAAGLDAVLARDHPPRIVVVAGGDMPGMVPGVLRLLADRLAAAEDLAAITLDASPPTPLPMALRPGAVTDALAACLAGGRRSLRSLLEAAGAATIPAADWLALDPSAATLRDIDTRGDLGFG
jgi:molybdopterin-guanine dinucleotide biosynthesis protein A